VTIKYNFGDFEMGKRIYMSWQAKEKNHDRRVKLYSTPGVSEVIIKDEWKNREKEHSGGKFSRTFLFIVVIAFLAALILFVLNLPPSNSSSNIDSIPTIIPIFNKTDINKIENRIHSLMDENTTPVIPALTQTESKIDITKLEKRIHALINENRINNGVSSLSFDDNLALIARGHSVDMSINNYFEHDNKKGEDPTMRGQDVGYTCRKDYGSYYTNGIAENIFQNNLYDSTSYVNGIPVSHDWNSLEDIAQSTVNGWMNSPGHRQNILKAQYDREGIGVAISSDDKVLITEDFC
jgi:uncharacterized protein YkwD